PIQDEKKEDYASQNEGVMHACGHDGHTASVLILAKCLSKFKDKINGKIVFIHQHAEEKAPEGAKPMIEDGCLNGVDMLFGYHLDTTVPVNKVLYAEGYVMAASDSFFINVIGKGGHAALPHDTIDSTVISSQLVVNLQQIISRKIDPLKPAVVSIGTLNSGVADNVISGRSTITGTVRTFDEEIRSKIENELEEITKHTCAASNATYTYNYERGYPAVWNDPKPTQFIDRCSLAFQDISFETKRPELGGEDFAYYGYEIPSTYFFVGANNPDIN